MVRFVAAPALADRMVFAGIAVLAVLPERTGLENFREADLREVFLPRDIGRPHPPRPSPALLGFAPDLFLCTAITSSSVRSSSPYTHGSPIFSQNVSQDQYSVQRYHPLIHAYALTRVRFNHFIALCGISRGADEGHHSPESRSTRHHQGSRCRSRAESGLSIGFRHPLWQACHSPAMRATPQAPVRAPDDQCLGIAAAGGCAAPPVRGGRL